MKTRNIVAAALAACACTSPAWALTGLTACRPITAPGAYALANNLQGSATAPCILITANNVTLDLRGFTITGTIQQDAIAASGARREITVRNGAVLGSRLAVGLGSTDGGVVENMEIGGNLAGIVLLRGRAEDNLVYGSGGNGIEGFEAITAKGNLVVENARHGIVAGPGSVVTDNVSADNGNVGILSAGNASGTVFTASAVVRRNVVNDNKGVGILVSCPAVVVNNAVDRNGGNDQENINLTGSGCVNRANLAF